MMKLIAAFGKSADAPKSCVEGGQFFVLSKASQECEPSTATSGSQAVISVGNLKAFMFGAQPCASEHNIILPARTCVV